jgi:hypothetical protein
MSFEEFKGLKNNPIYKNIDSVAPRGYDNSYKPFTTQEEAQRQ